MTWANRVTVIRILLIIPFIILMLNSHDPAMGQTYRYIAAAIFILIAGADALDGYLARKKKQMTKLGAFLDPMGDKLLMMSALLLLSSTRARVEGFELPDWVVVLIIGKDAFLLLGFIIVYFITLQVRVVPAPIGKAATLIQLVMVAGILLGPEMSHVIGGWIYFIRVLWWSAAATAILATLIYIRTGIRYIEAFDQQNGKRAG